VITIGGKVDLRAFHEWISKATHSQLAFAEARALTKLAKSSQGKVITDLPSHFHIRRPWVAKGILIKPARKQDFPSAKAVVGSRDYFMALQELGGIKKPKGGAGRVASGKVPAAPKGIRAVRLKKAAAKLGGASLAIPSANVREGGKGLIPLGERPKRVLQRPGVFIQTLKSGPSAGKLAILRRKGKERTPLQVLYIFRQTARVERRFHFTDTVRALVGREYGPVFLESLKIALEPKVKKR
jgi:hypothetical protein